MAKGFAAARDAFAEIEARKNSGGGGGFFFKLPKNKDEAVVRFIDDEVDWAWVHELPKPAGATYQKTEVCRDQDPETGQRTGEPCPGCDKDYRRKMQGVVRLIWRDGPVYEEVEEGGQKKKNYDTVVGHEDQFAKWTVGKMVIEDLDGIAATFKGLTNRDYTVTRKGLGLDTTYDIKPVVDDEGNTVKAPMSVKDEEIAAEAPEVSFKAPSFEEWGKGKSAGSGSSAPATTADVSPFRKRSED